MTNSGGDIVVRHVRIIGRVQGVWFRAWTAKEASGRQLDGWVRNRQDGSVEAVICGPESEVAAMIEACWRGPPLARVDDIQVEETSDDSIAAGQGFVMRDTA